MFRFDHLPVPAISTALPGPIATGLLARDAVFVSGSYTRVYPLVVAEGSGAVIVDVDGNRFLDFTAGIAVANTGHCHQKYRCSAIANRTQTNCGPEGSPTAR